jgi:hypothetical protein
METGTLLLPLEGEGISKIAVKKYGKETEIYVQSKDKNIKLPKGQTVCITDYHDDIYWIEPVDLD